MPIFYTDGSHTPKGTGFAWGLLLPSYDKFSVTGYAKIQKATNNIAELTAIREALAYRDKASLGPVILRTDSEYSIKSLTLWWNNWKKNGFKSARGEPVLNLELLKSIREQMFDSEGSPVVIFEHVRSHLKDGDPYNASVDIMARKAIDLGHFDYIIETSP